MNSSVEIDLFSPIYRSPTGQDQRNENLGWIGRIVEPYFDIGQPSYSILPGFLPEKFVPLVANETNVSSSWFKTAVRIIGFILKFISYLTLVIPAVMFVGKLAYRSENTFRIEKFLTKVELDHYLKMATDIIQRDVMDQEIQALSFSMVRGLKEASTTVRHLKETAKLLNDVLIKSSCSLTKENCKTLNLALETINSHIENLKAKMREHKDGIISMIRTHQQELAPQLEDPRMSEENILAIVADLNNMRECIDSFQEALDIKTSGKGENWVVGDKQDLLFDPQLLSKIKNKVYPKGICNLGATCFINASVQALFANSVIKNQILNGDFPTIVAMERALVDQLKRVSQNNERFLEPFAERFAGPIFQEWNNRQISDFRPFSLLEWNRRFDEVIAKIQEGSDPEIESDLETALLNDIKREFPLESQVILNKKIDWSTKKQIFSYILMSLQDYVQMRSVMDCFRVFAIKYEKMATTPANLRQEVVDLRASLHKANRMLDGLYAQNDAAPVIEYILDAIGFAVPLQAERSAKMGEDDFVRPEKTQGTQLIQIQMAKGCGKFQDLIDNFAKGEENGDAINQWNVTNEAGFVTHMIPKWNERHTIVGQPPKYIQIQFKRFKPDEAGVLRKNSDPIDFANREVDLTSIFSTPPELKALYKVKAGVIHRGEISGGHYYSVVEKAGQWFRCDDSSIVDGKFNLRDELSKSYVVFLEKIDPAEIIDPSV